VNVHELGIHEQASTHGLPSHLEPLPIDIPVDENVKVRIPVLLKFQDSDIDWSRAEPPFEVHAQLCPGLVQVSDRISLDLVRIES
jgi:hypothetical protein